MRECRLLHIFLDSETNASSGLVKHSCTFFFAELFALLGSMFLLLGAAFWTTAIRKAQTVNGLLVESTSASVGIVVSAGPGLYMAWSAVACMIVSITPYLIL